jgi:hypothetical protein
MNLRQMKLLSVAVGLAIVVVAWVCYSLRPAMEVSSATPLWSSEYDASRMGTTYPGPGVAVAQMKCGEELRVVWIAQGKDYRAAYVIRPNWQAGWVLLWQNGLRPIS